MSCASTLANAAGELGPREFKIVMRREVPRSRTPPHPAEPRRPKLQPAAPRRTLHGRLSLHLRPSPLTQAGMGRTRAGPPAR